MLDPAFRIPSQWRVSAGVDYDADLGPLGDGWQLGGNVIWSRVRDGLTWVDLRVSPNGVLPDGRPRYKQLASISAITSNPDLMLTNTDQGYSWNIVGHLDKVWQNGISIGGTYTFQRAKDVSPGTSSVAFSNWDNTASLDPNNSAYGISNYQVDNSLRLRFSYDARLFGDNASRFELFFNSRAGQRYSYAFSDAGSGSRSVIFGTLGNDGRHLIYVPNVSSITADPIVSYAAGFDFAGFQKFVQDSELNRHQGSIAPKNIGRSPRWNKLDLRISQEVPFFLGGKIQLFADMENVLNMLDSDWGSLRQVNFPYRASLVNVTCLQANGAPVTGAGQACAKYEYSSFRAPSETIYTNYSIWQVRLGVRLDFRGL